jgi:hypothetical protein
MRRKRRHIARGFASLCNDNGMRNDDFSPLADFFTVNSYEEVTNFFTRVYFTS